MITVFTIVLKLIVNRFTMQKYFLFSTFSAIISFFFNNFAACKRKQ